jgi:hypothetical protein
MMNFHGGKVRQHVHRVWGLFALVGTLASTSPAWAQDDLPGFAPGMGAASAPPSKDDEAPPSDMPETHAASGGTDTTLPQGNEPSLPPEPLKISDKTKARIGTDGDPEAEGTPEGAKRQFYGVYYNEQAGEYRHRIVFPLWSERTKPSETNPKVVDRASLYGPFYFNRRSAEHREDIFFPIVWDLEAPQKQARTTVVGPFVNRRTKTESDDWLLPLYATGTRPDGGYTIIPPLLTYRDRNIEGGTNIIGPGFCAWKGGQSCDTRTAQDIDLGIAPLYFFGQNKDRRYEIVPPLIHYYNYNIGLQSWTNIWGPYYRRHTEKREMFHLIPFYFSIWGENERHTTVAPLFHYGYHDKEKLLITPLFLNHESQKGENTFVTWGYAQHRGATKLDMVTPLYWSYRDPRIGLKRHLLFPLFYSNESPRESMTSVFPLFSYQKRHGLSSSLWITPLFNTKKGIQSWSTAILPLFFFGRDGHDSHAVVAPLYFDFKGLKNRTTVVPPLLYVRHRTPDTLTHVFANLYYHERNYKNGREWQFHLLPLLSFGETPNGHFWNVLYGLAGYTRQGPKSTVRALWIPFKTSN